MFVSMTGFTNSPSPGVGSTLSDGSGSELAAAEALAGAAVDDAGALSAPSDSEQAAKSSAATSSGASLGATVIRSAVSP
jgi:hypothetical protein